MASLRCRAREHTGEAGLRQLFPTANAELIDLLFKLLHFDPRKRPTAAEALRHPYLAAYHEAPEEDLPTPEIEMLFEHRNPCKEELRELVWEEVLRFQPWLAPSYFASSSSFGK